MKSTTKGINKRGSLSQIASLLTTLGRNKNGDDNEEVHFHHHKKNMEVRGVLTTASKNSGEMFLLTPATQASTVVIDSHSAELMFASQSMLCGTDDDEEDNSTIASTSSSTSETSAGDDDLERRLTELEHDFEVDFELSWSGAGDEDQGNNYEDEQHVDILAASTNNNNEKQEQQQQELGRLAEQDYNDTDSYQLTRRRGIKVIKRST